jgi:hypothetical protein
MKKILFPLFVASLVLNAGFVLVFGLGSRPASAPAVTATAAAVSHKPAVPVLSADVWPSLKSDDFRELATRLRAAGFPIEIVRAIVSAQIYQMYEPRIKALQPPNERLPFWKDPVSNPQNEVALRKLYREVQKTVADLLGENPDSSDRLYLTQQGGKLDFLPTAKADEVRQIVRDFNERRSDLYAGSVYEAVRDQVTALEKAQRDALARVLTPAEMLDYDLRNSSTARQLRTALAAFDPTEAEFRAIYQARQAFDERYSGAASFIALNQEQTRQRTEAEAQLKEQIKTMLPPERAAAYERANDYYYRETSQLVSRLALPPETTLNLWNLKQDFDERMQAAYKIPTTEERNARLAELQQEAIAKVTPLLGGASRLETYKQYGGSWLNNLAPRPARPKG